jgi:ABC-type amino acid transport substrate-binding protein
MFTSILIVSSFTAAIATALTVGQLDQPIKRLEDLYGASVATVAGSTSEEFLQYRGIRYQSVDSVPQALDRLAANDIDAVVYDAPILQYLIALHHPDTLRVLPQVLQRQDYGIALPQRSAMREAVNNKLLRIVSDREWTVLLERYLGKG